MSVIAVMMILLYLDLLMSRVRNVEKGLDYLQYTISAEITIFLNQA